MNRRTGLASAAWLVFERDLRLAFRRWQQVTHPVVFFVMVATLFPLALSPEPVLLRTLAPGVVWVAALLMDTFPREATKAWISVGPPLLTI